MKKTKKQLYLIIKLYPIKNNQSLVVLYVSSSEDAKFKLQVRFTKKNTGKGDKDIAPFIEFFRKEIELFSKNNRLLTNFASTVANNYPVDHSLNEFKKSIQEMEFIFNKKSHRIGWTEKEHAERFHPDFYWLENIGSKEQPIHFGYLIPEDPKGKIPLHSVKVYDTSKKLIKQIYLFPISHDSLTIAKTSITKHYSKPRKTSIDKNTQTFSPPPSPSIFEKACNFLKKAAAPIGEIMSEEIPHYNLTDEYPDLDIPYVILNPDAKSYSDTQTRIDMQAIIAEILIHLKKISCFRTTGKEKTRLFQELSKAIANDTPLSNIENRLDSHDKWMLLAKHRDPWGPLSFFKGKTRSLKAWHLLKDLTTQSVPVPELSSHHPVVP